MFCSPKGRGRSPWSGVIPESVAILCLVMNGPASSKFLEGKGLLDSEDPKGASSGIARG